MTIDKFESNVTFVVAFAVVKDCEKQKAPGGRAKKPSASGARANNSKLLAEAIIIFYTSAKSAT